MYIAMRNKPVRKGYMLNDSNYPTFQKRQNYGQQQDPWLSGLKEVRREKQIEHRGSLGQGNFSV